MAFWDGIKNRIQEWLLPEEFWARSERREHRSHIELLREYARGDQKEQIKRKPFQADDNLIINFSGLVVERSISMLFGGGVEFDFDDDREDEPEKEYIDQVYRVNKKSILLHKLAQYGGATGTMYIKIMPGELDGGLPRLIPQDPLYMWVKTQPDDVDTVTEYECLYAVKNERGEVDAYMELTSRQENGHWLIELYKAPQGRKWELIESTPWNYAFPPILHWQNLPSAESPYGISDIENIIPIQDKINFIASNLTKIIRYHAHPKTFGRGFTKTDKASWGADEMIILDGETGMIQNLEMQTDLASSQQFLMTLRQMLFDVSRTVDISSMSDKLGALTNFGLRVLYMDSLAKNATKRELWGDALVELNRRLLILNGSPEGQEGGKVVWSDKVLPRDDKTDIEVMRTERELGIVDKETMAKKRGYDWGAVKERLADEQAENDNIGAIALENFLKGGSQQ